MSTVVGSDPCAWAESHAYRRGVQEEADSKKEICHVTSDYLWSTSEDCLDDVAMVFYNGPEVTYRDLQKTTKKVVLMLQGLGLKKGDVVSAQLPNWEEFVYINLACCTLGLVFNPIIHMKGENYDIPRTLGHARKKFGKNILLIILKLILIIGVINLYVITHILIFF